jgi:hypothetical protein
MRPATGERGLELEDTASGGLSLVIYYEDGGLDQIRLTRNEEEELYKLLEQRRRARRGPTEEASGPWR